jgi:CheY-like chemotaxis protein
MLGTGAAPENRERMLAAGASAFLSKPVDVRTLLTALDRFIEPNP